MGKFQKLSDTEMEVMRMIWASDHPVTSGELLDFFSSKKGKEWKGQTIATFLARLVEKGVLLSSKRGRGNAYTPRVSPEEYRRQEAQSMLDRMYKGSVRNFLSALYDGEKVSEKDLVELKKWLKGK